MRVPAADVDLAADLELAGDLVRTAGKLAASMRWQGVDVSTKTSISDLVTNADHAAEAQIAARLAEERPDDGLIGEEGSVRPGRRTWVIDPVDGTYNFVSGLPAWCSALALTDGDALLLGAIYQASSDELWIGGPGLGVTLNGVELPPLVDQPLRAVSLATYLHPPRLNRPELREPLLRAVSASAVLRMVGSGSVELSSVASGRLGAFLHANTPAWDWLPGAALVQGVGGVTEIFDDGQMRWHLAGNRQSVADLRSALAG
jgi:myo-inositol-1(or 4)-monophosphatase